MSHATKKLQQFVLEIFINSLNLYTLSYGIFLKQKVDNKFVSRLNCKKLYITILIVKSAESFIVLKINLFNIWHKL